MAKQQRSVQQPPDIYKLCEMYEAGTGIKFNRQVTAALLAYFFADLLDCAPGNEGSGGQPAAEWMRHALAVERGEVKIEELPLALLDGHIESLERSLLAHERGDFKDRPWNNPDTIRAELDIARSRRQTWKNNIEDFKDPAAAMKYYLTPLAK